MSRNTGKSHVINNLDDEINNSASTSSKLLERDNTNYDTFASSNASLEQQSLLDSFLPTFGHVHYR